MTKFYLHATTSGLPSGTLPSDEQSSLTPDSNDFEGSRTTNRLMNTSVGVSQANLTNTSTGDTNAHNYYVTRFVSPLIYEAHVQAQTWTVEYGAKEANAAANFPRNGAGVMYVNCYIWKPSDGTKVGTILDGNSNADGEEASTTQTVINFTFAGAAVDGLTPGDAVLVFEVWAQVTQGNGTTRVQDFYYDGTTENSTSNEAAFLSTPQDLQLTNTDGIETPFGCGGSVASTANTTQYWSLVGRPTPTTTEAEAQLVIRKAGTISRLSVVLEGNSVTGSTTFTVRKNGVDTSMLVTASTTGGQLIEDLNSAHNITVAAGDKINLKTVPGAATNTFTIGRISLNFKPDDGTATTLMGLANTTNWTSASTTQYSPISGNLGGTSSTEVRAKCRIRKAGTFRYFAVYVTSNARTTDFTFKTRKNGADGNIAITFTAGQTGLKEETSLSDTVAVGDDYNISITSGSGTEQITYTIFSCHFVADDYSGIAITGNTTLSNVAANLTRYFNFMGSNNVYTTEALTMRRYLRLNQIILKDLFVTVQNNGVTATSTLQVNINTAVGNLSVSIGSSTNGQIGDTTHTDVINSGDNVSFKLVTGATGTSLDITCIVIHFDLPRKSKSFIYKFNVLKRISKPFIYKFNVVQRISKSFIYKFNVLKRITKSFIYKFNVLKRITKPFIYKFNVVHRTSKSFIYKFNVVQRVSKVFRYRFNVTTRISKSFIYKFNVLKRISKPFIYKFNVQQRISKIFRYRFNVVQRISKPFIYKFNVLQRISKSFIYLFNVQQPLQRVSKSFIYKFNVVQRTSKSFIYKFNVQQRISKSFTYKFNILKRITKSFIYKFNVVQRVSKIFRYRFNVVQRISKPFVYKFNVTVRVTKSFIYKFNVVQRISKPFTYKFNVQKRISKAFVYKFNVTVRVSKSFIYKFNVVQRVSKDFTYLFNIVSASIRVSKSFIYKFNVVQRTSKSFTYKFNITTRITKAFTYPFNVTVRVTKSFTYKFNVVKRVSKNFIYKFNVVQRVSKPFTYKFNVVQRISKQFRYKFNVTVRVTKQFIYKFNITTRVTKSFTYKFNILKRISKPFTYKFNVVQRISKIFRYKFNILQRISKTFGFPFNITVRVSKPFVYLFNITTRVSKDFTYNFNIVERVSKSFTFPFKITAPIQLFAQFAETISINFAQGFGEIFVSGRESINVLRKFFS